MAKPPSINSAFDGPELHLYRHISVADFDPRQWCDDATGRVIIHRDGCPGLSGRGTCLVTPTGPRCRYLMARAPKGELGLNHRLVYGEKKLEPRESP